MIDNQEIVFKIITEAKMINDQKIWDWGMHPGISFFYITFYVCVLELFSQRISLHIFNYIFVFIRC